MVNNLHCLNMVTGSGGVRNRKKSRGKQSRGVVVIGSETFRASEVAYTGNRSNGLRFAGTVAKRYRNSSTITRTGSARSIVSGGMPETRRNAKRSAVARSRSIVVIALNMVPGCSIVGGCGSGGDRAGESESDRKLNLDFATDTGLQRRCFVDCQGGVYCFADGQSEVVHGLNLHCLGLWCPARVVIGSGMRDRIGYIGARQYVERTKKAISGKVAQ
jgi:hypothetical protein